MFYSEEAFAIHAKLNTIEFIFQNFIISLYDGMPKEAAFAKLGIAKDGVLNGINELPFPNASPADADKMRKEMLKIARELIGSLQDRYKPDT